MADKVTAQPTITKEEFRQKMEFFFQWASDRPRSEEFWWLSLEDFAGQRYSQEMRARLENDPK